MIRWLRSLFAWRKVENAGLWAYSENAITGQRRAVRRFRGGYQPLSNFIRPGDIIIDD